MTEVGVCPVAHGQVDLFDPNFVNSPNGLLAELRETAPVYFDEITGCWLVSRHADIRSVLRRPKLFRPENALTAITAIDPSALRTLARVGFELPATLANNGGPSHADFRALVRQFFAPSAIATALPLIRELALESAALVKHDLDANNEADLVALVTRYLPARVLIALLHLDDIDLPTLKRWSTASLELFWGNPDVARQRELAVQAAEFYSWLRVRITSADPSGVNLFSQLAAHRTPDGQPLRIEESVGICYFLLVAGQETTTQFLSAVLRKLIGQPDIWRRLANADAYADKLIASECVEEVLRLETPVVTWRRITSEPVMLGEQLLPADAQVLLMLAGSGSDPDVFEEPDRFVPGRVGARKHLAFGFGRHYCLGATLARTEAHEVLRILARELPDIALIEAQPPMLGLLSFRAPLRLLVAPQRP
ncbi:MAG: cytochrome P450 [Actinomycetota bacterium]|nr:cytochrome P450 [Actinomycetota bacterium]